MVHLFYRQTTKSLEWPTMAKNRRQWPLSSAGRRYLYVRYPTSHLHLITSLDQVRSDTGDVQLCTTLCAIYERHSLCTIHETYNCVPPVYNLWEAQPLYNTWNVQLCTTCVQFMRGTTSYVQYMERTTVYHLCTIYERYNLPATK